MTALTRRHLLSGAAATGAVALTHSPSQAAAPATGKQVAGIYRYKVGDIEVTVVTDGANRLPITDAFVGNVKKEEVNAALAAAFMEPGVFIGPYNPIVINTGGKLVLIDCGNGISQFEPSKGAVGRTIANLAAAGVQPKDIDIVLMSHLHTDHTNGIRAADNSMAFPNAEIMVPGKDWDFWTSAENAAKAGPVHKVYFDNVQKIYAGIENKVTKYDWDKEVAPGITAIGAPGHTPGHTTFVVASGSSKILIQSDVTNIPEFFLRNPDWHVVYDIDPQQAQETRHKFYDMAAAEKALVVGFHFTFPSIGYVEKDGAKYRLVPVAWNPLL